MKLMKFLQKNSPAQSPCAFYSSQHALCFPKHAATQGGWKGSANCAGVWYHSPSASRALSIPPTSFHKPTVSITSCFCKRSSKLAECHNYTRAAGTSYHHVCGENPCRGSTGQCTTCSAAARLFVCLSAPTECQQHQPLSGARMHGARSKPTT